MPGSPLDASAEWWALGIFAYLIKPFEMAEAERYVARAFDHCQSEKRGAAS